MSEQFTEDELYYLWKRFEKEPDHGAEALAGFAGLPEGTPNKAMLPLVLKFMQRSEREADERWIREQAGWKMQNLI